MEAIVARRFIDQAHPASPVPRSDWAPPRTHRRLQYGIAVAVQTAALMLAIVAILAFAALAAAAVGVDPSAGVTR